MRGSDIVGAEGKAETEIVQVFSVQTLWNSGVKLACEALSTEPVDNTVDECRITGCIPYRVAAMPWVYEK